MTSSRDSSSPRERLTAGTADAGRPSLSQWQPIETAPKDDQRILAYDPVADAIVVIGGTPDGLSRGTANPIRIARIGCPFPIHPEALAMWPYDDPPVPQSTVVTDIEAAVLTASACVASAAIAGCLGYLAWAHWISGAWIFTPLP